MSLPLLALLATADGWAATQRFALLVGANDGGASRITLRYAVSDAQAMEQVLQELGGLAPGASVLLEDPDPGALQAGLGRVNELVHGAQAQGDRAEVIVYYSGHSDTQGLLLGEQRYAYSELRDGLAALDAEVRILILDSCSSGAITRTKGGSHGAPFLVDESVQVQGYAYLTSASADEAAQEADAIGGSFFTQALVSGLRGGADSSQDGRVTLNEAYRFAYDQTLERTERSSAGPQHASFDIQMMGTGDLVLTELVSSGSTLELAAELQGRVFVRDAQGDLVVELDKLAGRAISLGLEPGSYRVMVVVQGDTLSQASLDLSAGERTVLDPDDLAGTTRQLAVRRGDMPLNQRGLGLGALPLPYLSENAYRVELSLLATRSGAVNGAQLALLGAGVTRQVSGMQGALLASWSEGDARGVQTSLGLAWTSGRMYGVQAAPVTLAGQHRGLQVGVFAKAHEQAGTQLALVNLAGRGRVQLGGSNLAGQSNGAQLGLVNLAQDSRGLQLGLFNMAGRGTGVQVGLINLAGEDYAGSSYGLLSVQRGGHNGLELGRNELGLNTLALSTGGRRLYGVLCAGYSQELYSFGLGPGLHQSLSERFFVDSDLLVLSQSTGSVASLRGRARVGLSLSPSWAALAGPVAQVALTPDTGAALAHLGPDFATPWGTPWWVGGSLSLRFSPRAKLGD